MTSQSESLAVIWALRPFRELIFYYKIHVHTGHYAVTETFKGNSFTGQFARWQLMIQEFNPTFSYIPGKVNPVTDALSRNVAPVSAVVDHVAMPTIDEIKRHQHSDRSVLMLHTTSYLVTKLISSSCK